MQTSCGVADSLNIKHIKVEHGLCEWHSAKWFSSAPLFPSVASSFSVDGDYIACYSAVAYPETIPEMFERYKHTISHVLEKFPSGNVVIVTHGYGVDGIARAFDDSIEIDDTPYCCLTHVVQKARNEKGSTKITNNNPADWEIVTLCDTYH